MTGPLERRAAVVTGVSRRTGIGFATVRRLSTAGASVFIHSWVQGDEFSDPVELDAMLGELRQGASRIGHHEADFADPESPARVIALARQTFGHLDILVVNHTRSQHRSLSELTAEEIDAHLHVNVRASLLLVKEFAEQHDGRPGGRVVLFTSGQHLAPMRSEVPYAVSKGAIHQATMTLSEELIDRGITVNTVNPGPTDTGWAIKDVDPSPAMPLGRWGHPDDAARLVAWLCSDDASWITGQVIDSEGGFRRWAPR
ncbi:MAG: family oxidoreductase [Thermoleophilia bacterium]|nr:family oxidoreductase [Thermoleophilia bacterium]